MGTMGQLECQWRRHEFNDSDDQAGQLTGWNQQYEQLSAGKFSGSIMELWTQGAQIIFESSNQVVHQSGRSWPASRTFLIPLQQEGVARFGRWVMHPDSAVTLGPDEELDFLTAPRGVTASITLDTQVLEALSVLTEDESLEARYGDAARLGAGKPELDSLRQAFLEIFQTLRQQPQLFGSSQVCRMLRDNLVMEIFATLTPQADDDRRRRVQAHRRIVGKAKEYVIEHRYEAVTIPELCKAIGVSRRNLQLCFNEQMGCSPVQFLRAIRLNRVRRELRETAQRDVLVRDVASRWGFWHLSSFSAHYKAMFAELPSETFARARQASSARVQVASLSMQ